MRRAIALAVIALVTLAAVEPASAERPPPAVSVSALTAGLYLSGQPDSALSESTLRHCRKRDRGGWRCDVILRWRTRGFPAGSGYQERCDAVLLASPGGWRFRPRAGTCPAEYLGGE